MFARCGVGDASIMPTGRDPINPTDPTGHRQPAPAAIPAILLTREGERELRAKLAALREVIDVELPRRLRSAREFGDATGNDDYLQILEELAEVLAAARIVEGGAGSANVVAVGSTVTIRTAGRMVSRRLVGAYEAAGDAVSASSPIGRAVLGRSPGDRVLVELPNGAEQEIEIVAVIASGAEPVASGAEPVAA